MTTPNLSFKSKAKSIVNSKATLIQSCKKTNIRETISKCINAKENVRRKNSFIYKSKCIYFGNKKNTPYAIYATSIKESIHPSNILLKECKEFQDVFEKKNVDTLSKH